MRFFYIYFRYYRRIGQKDRKEREVHMEEEAFWIKQVLAGNKQAYGHIINKYKNPLYATILRMTKNPQDAQDLVQEAFIKIYNQLGKYDQKGAFSSWLYRVAVNHCMDEFRKKSSQIKQAEINEASAVNTKHPEVILLKKEKNRQVEKLISTLPEDERIIILLRYANELPYEEIAETTGMPLSMVRNKLHRAKKKMRETVKKQGGYYNELSNGG
ncbi:RNA polymerase sigma factor [Bacillus infantis]|uniref:RNA polymerase sigma factor n=1 Tax=Bacillus infantis TaxID=324767 RepID=UPI0029EE87CC|nr:RNA polymerase sigma factor [Bacillus infantis]